MNDTYDLVELAKLEDDLWLLEQQAKHVISGLGRTSTELAQRVEGLQQASALYAEIRRIRDRVHAVATNMMSIHGSIDNKHLSTETGGA